MDKQREGGRERETVQVKIKAKRFDVIKENHGGHEEEEINQRGEIIKE